jgi:hypothetical protein
MVSVIENWTDMEGIILSIRQSETLSNFMEAEVMVEKANDIEGFPNLLKNTLGETATVFIPKDLATKLHLNKGLRISFRARGGMNKIFAHPDLVAVEHSRL